jgi:hemolysin hlyA
MKTIWKATVCIVAVLLSFSIYSCGDDDDDAVGSRDLLLGTWNGVYYLSQEWEDGEKVSDSKEDFVNGTNRYSIEFKEDGTYVEKMSTTPPEVLIIIMVHGATPVIS